MGPPELLNLGPSPTTSSWPFLFSSCASSRDPIHSFTFRLSVSRLLCHRSAPYLRSLVCICERERRTWTSPPSRNITTGTGISLAWRHASADHSEPHRPSSTLRGSTRLAYHGPHGELPDEPDLHRRRAPIDGQRLSTTRTTPWLPDAYAPGDRLPQRQPRHARP